MLHFLICLISRYIFVKNHKKLHDLLDFLLVLLNALIPLFWSQSTSCNTCLFVCVCVPMVYALKRLKPQAVTYICGSWMSPKDLMQTDNKPWFNSLHLSECAMLWKCQSNSLCETGKDDQQWLICFACFDCLLCGIFGSLVCEQPWSVLPHHNV